MKPKCPVCTLTMTYIYDKNDQPYYECPACSDPEGVELKREKRNNDTWRRLIAREPHLRTKSWPGFTLIEVLIVVAVLMLLAAVLWPILARARHKAYQSVCVSNLRQIGQATALYLHDWDDRFPGCYFLLQSPYYVDLNVAIQPYTKGNQVLICPERFTTNKDCPGRCLGYGYNWGSGIGWATTLYKADGLVFGGEDGMAVGVNHAQVDNPAHTFLSGDTNDYYFQTLLRDVMPGVRSQDNPLVNDHGDVFEPPRHFGGNAFVFVDGHVQWLSFPGGRCKDGGARIVSDMSSYSRLAGLDSNLLPW